MRQKLLVQAVALALALPAGIAVAGNVSVMKADSLLAIDMNRPAVIEGVIANWKSKLTAEQEAVIRATLAKLRADRLMAASLAPSFEGLLAVLKSAEKLAGAGGKVQEKVAASELIYVAVDPCRDRRYAQPGRADRRGRPAQLLLLQRQRHVLLLDARRRLGQLLDRLPEYGADRGGRNAARRTRRGGHDRHGGEYDRRRQPHHVGWRTADLDPEHQRAQLDRRRRHRREHDHGHRRGTHGRQQRLHGALQRSERPG